MHPAQCEFLAQDALGRVLRNRGEAERHIGGQRQIQLHSLFAVDEDDLAAHLDGRVEHAAQHTHALESLECAGLYPNGFRVLGRIEKGIHYAAVNSVSGQFDGGRQADRARARDEDIGVGHAVIMGAGG